MGREKSQRDSQKSETVSDFVGIRNKIPLHSEIKLLSVFYCGVSWDYEGMCFMSV